MIHRMWLGWKTRGWRADDHDDCMSFMGPCNLCLERLEYKRLCEPAPMTRWQRLMLWLTPHATEVVPPVWGAGGGTRVRCTENACAPDCPKLMRRLSYMIPQMRLANKAWLPEVVQRTPCCGECAAFGPCADCVTASGRRIGKTGLVTEEIAEVLTQVRVCKNGHHIPSGSWCYECP